MSSSWDAKCIQWGEEDANAAFEAHASGRDCISEGEVLQNTTKSYISSKPCSLRHDLSPVLCWLKAVSILRSLCETVDALSCRVLRSEDIRAALRLYDHDGR